MSPTPPEKDKKVRREKRLKDNRLENKWMNTKPIIKNTFGKSSCIEVAYFRVSFSLILLQLLKGYELNGISLDSCYNEKSLEKRG